MFMLHRIVVVSGVTTVGMDVAHDVEKEVCPTLTGAGLL